MAWESVPGNSAGQMNGDGSRKLLLHDTEGSTIEGAVAAYRANNSWPHLTVDCRRRRVVQHLPLGVAARSLRNDPGGADETNRDGSAHVQIEIVGFVNNRDGTMFSSREDYLWFGREVVGPVCRAQSIPLVSTVHWTMYPGSYGLSAPQRLSVTAWDAYSGVLGHQHAPDNSHGDPGLIDIDLILSAARGDDMLDAEDRKFIEDIRDAINEATFANARRVVQYLGGGQGNTLLGGQDWAPGVTLPKLAAAVAGINAGDVDESQVAALVLAGLSPQAIADALPDSIATEVADLLAARLAS